MKLNLIINCAFCIVNCALLCSCKAQKPVATTHTERIEERVMPVAIGADTIIIESVFSAGEATASSVSSVNQRSLSLWRKNSVRNKNNSVRNTNSAGVKSVQIRRATSCEARERIEEKEELKSELSVLSVGDEKSRSEKKSVHSVVSVSEKNSSVRNKNSVRIKSTRGNQLSAIPQKHDSPILSPCIRGTSGAEGVKIKSTRGVNISRHETDTTSTLRITLRPDTVFLPYTYHIRSDTIVVPDRICQQKLNRSNMTNFILILILIAIIIIYLKNRMTR